MIADIYGKRNIDVHNLMSRNKARFEEGKDWYCADSLILKQMGYKSTRGARVIAEPGYLKLVKIFTDKVALQVQGHL